MKRFECQFEAEALAAALQSRWPERVDAELRAHIRACPICSDTVVLATAFDQARQETRGAGVVPDSGHVWRVAQIRARREDAAAAMRPITAAQVFALASVFAVIGACFGATSTWFQSLLPNMVSGMTGAKAQALLAVVAEHGLLIGVMAGITVLVPALVIFAASAE